MAQGRVIRAFVAVAVIVGVIGAACSPDTPPTGGSPQAVISAMPTVGPAPLTVSFSASNSTAPSGSHLTAWTWTFGDGSTASGETASHTYAAGVFNAKLTVADSGAAKSSSTIQVLVNPDRPPVAAISATPTSGDAPLSVVFTSSGSKALDGSLTSYAWTFGDGSTSADTDPTHVYSSAGAYTAVLTVTDSNGLADVATTAVAVSPHQRPVAVAGADSTTGFAPLSVAFSSVGTHAVDGSVTTYSWDFGDHTASTSANPHHTYATGGSYTATLTVTDDSGASDTTSVAIAVSTPVAPTAVAQADPTSGHPPLDVTFSSAGSQSPDGSIVSYLWDFGDGPTTSTDPNPTHTYAAVGSYTATLTVTDSHQLTDSTTVTVDVSPVPNVPPVAAAGAVPASGDAPLNVAFSSSGSIDPDGTIAGYSWDFGDGTPVSTDPGPTHAYTATGHYVVTLTVTDNQSATGTATTTVDVAPHQKPVASAATLPLSGKAPLTVAFSSAGSHALDGSVAGYSWGFGDSSTASTDTNPSHTYTAAGTYDATLTVTDTSGATDSMIVVVAAIANVAPTAVAAATPSSGFAPLTVGFSSSGSIDPDGTVVNYSWDFGDGSTASTDPNPTHTYATAGNYTATLTVTDDNGANGTASSAIGALADPSAPTWASGSALTVTSTGVTFAALAWPAASDNIAVTGYRLTVDSGTPIVLPPTSLSSSATGLSAGKTHTFSIAAVDAAGNSTSLSSASTVTRQKVATAISVGPQHECALVAGVPSCWGDAFGVGTSADDLSPVVESGINNGTALGAGLDYNCVLLSTGGVRCWGQNNFGQLGNGTTAQSSTPVTVSGLTNASAISLGRWTSCALVASGAVDCWGQNNVGQLGNGTTANASTPQPVTGITNAVAIQVGNATACAVLRTGAVDCWGSGTSGQLGNGATVNSSAPVAVAGIPNATAVGVGMRTACAVLGDGSVRCWGDNTFGQLGNSTTTTSSTPVSVLGLSGATSITVATQHVCSLAAGVVSCWGDDGYGELGNGVVSTTPFTAPQRIATGLPATSVVTGGFTTCALLTDGTTQCWGSNSNGQAGSGVGASTTAPLTISQVPNPTAVSTGSGSTCAVFGAGSVACFGSNAYGQSGGPVLTDNVFTPQVLPGISTATAVSAGGESSCALLRDTTVTCWGLLAGTSPIPAAVPGLSGALSISVGQYVACAVVTGGTVKCWGNNWGGSLGDGNTNPSSTPLTVIGVSGATAVSVGDAFACALVSGGAAACWGGNDGIGGYLGNASYPSSLTAVPVTGITGASSIGAGAIHTCVVTGGVVQCWGSEGSGDFGNGVVGDTYSTPQQATGLTGAVSVIGMLNSTCALLGSGSVSCFGSNDAGLFGVPGYTYSTTPVTVTGVSGVTALATGYGSQQMCGLFAGPTLKCWGDGKFGEIANPNAISSVPQTVSL